MKINKYTFILPILFCIIIYLLGGFIAADIDFTNWDIFGRVIIVILFLGAILSGIGISQVKEE